MSQETKNYQYERNDFNTYGVRGSATGGGTEVIANPTLAGTEDDLTGLQVGETKYKVEQPINVVANPTLAGTEDDLTGLQVGTTKYKVPDGSYTLHTYIANKTYTSSDSDFQQLRDDIINNRPIKFDDYIVYYPFYSGNGYIYISDASSVNAGEIHKNSVTITDNTTNVVISSVRYSVISSTPGVDKLYNTSNHMYKSLYVGANSAGTNVVYGKPASDFGLGTITTAPSANNTDGLKIVVLTSEPATYYDGYYYIIAPST